METTGANPDWLDWLDSERAIPHEVSAKCGVVSHNGKLAFEYRLDGILRYLKIRIVTEDGGKSFMRDRKNVESSMFLEHFLQTDPDPSSPLVICEGEIDALSLVTAGIPNVVSVPDGAQLAELGTGKIIPEEDKAFGWLWSGSALKPHLAQFERIVLATDADKKGRILREELAVRFERWRCDFVTYPDGCKDANEVLQQHGPAVLAKLVAEAKPMVPNRLVAFGELPEIGTGEVYSSGFKGLDEGLRFGLIAPELVVVTGEPGSGKALALDTPVPTPSGWTTMGELSVGDKVYGKDGKPCTVLRATDVMFGHDCFEMEFSDGTKIVADADHQWMTSTRASRLSAQRNLNRGPLQPRGTDQSSKRKHPSVVTTREIAATLRIQGNQRANHAVELCDPVDGNPSILPIDPYTLGAWLGDGRNRDGGICLCEQESRQILVANGETLVEWNDGKTCNIPNLKVKLAMLGLLQNKHIPAVYKGATAKDRLSLLQGLMDTDGHCSDSRLCEFVNTNKNLAADVHELACSLGLKATMSEGRAMLRGRDCGAKYRVVFTAPDFPVFRLGRKVAKQKVGKPNRTGRRYIVSCFPVPSVPVRCIEVDSPDHLFLVTRSYIPTHNSEFTVCLGANLANYHQLPGAILQFEDRSVRVRETLIRYAMANVTGIENRDGARTWVNRWFRTIEPEQNVSDDVDYNLDWLRATIREARVRHGCRWVILDPWNELDHMWDRSQSEAVYVNDALRKLKRIARAHQIILMIVAHPSKEGGRQKDITELDLYGISGSAAWANKADHGIIVHRPDKSRGEVFVKVAKSKDHSMMGIPGIVRMTYQPSTAQYRYVGMGV